MGVNTSDVILVMIVWGKELVVSNLSVYLVFSFPSNFSFEFKLSRNDSCLEIDKGMCFFQGYISAHMNERRGYLDLFTIRDSNIERGGSMLAIYTYANETIGTAFSRVEDPAMLRVDNNPANYPSNNFFKLSYLLGNSRFALSFVEWVRDRVYETSYVIEGEYFKPADRP